MNNFVAQIGDHLGLQKYVILYSGGVGGATGPVTPGRMLKDAQQSAVVI